MKYLNSLAPSFLLPVRIAASTTALRAVRSGATQTPGRVVTRSMRIGPTACRAVASIGAVLAVALLAGACSGGSSGSPGSSGSAANACDRNAAVGTITVVTGFDFAASPGIIDPIVAEGEGYFDELCLDVEIQPGFAPQNHVLVASGNAQFANAGSFGEVVKANVDGDAGLVLLAHYGKTAIEALVVPEDSDIDTLDDLAGKVVGIKGDLPFSLQTMLGQAGVDRASFDELLLDTFDPVAAFDLGVDALPVYKSNEPIQLESAGFGYRMFDPLDADVASSFGLLVVGEDFLAEHPLVVQDFLRASLKAMALSVAEPQVAIGHVLERIDDSEGSFLGDYTETPRWGVERELVASLTPDGQGYGQVDLDRLGAEISALTAVGVFPELPDWKSMVAGEIADAIYDGSDAVAWEPYR